MSASVLHPWPYGTFSLVCGLPLLLASSPLLAAGRQYNCSHPLVPEHGGFLCGPSPCQGFPPETYIWVFCEPGFHLSSNTKPISRCHHDGKWHPPIPACIRDSPSMKSDNWTNILHVVCGITSLLFITVLLSYIGIFLCPPPRHRSSDQLDPMVDGLPVSLPSYEEAVYDSSGQHIPACSAPGPTQLLLAQESPFQNGQVDSSHHPLLSGQSPENPPPPYEEVQSPHPRDRTSDRGVSDDRDT
ncbi:sushi domain-containing protein 6-like [Pholidichthys leucotaenia]